jgi:hypothetical protein
MAIRRNQPRRNPALTGIIVPDRKAQQPKTSASTQAAYAALSLRDLLDA